MRIAKMLNANVKVWQMVAAMVITSFALAGLATANNTAEPPAAPDPPAQQKMITACAHKRSGDLRLLLDRRHGEKDKKMHRSHNDGQKPGAGPKPLQCRKNELTLRWAVEGPQGPTGPTGATGETGPTGPTA